MAKNSANIAMFSVFLGGFIYMIAKGITVDDIVSSTSHQLKNAYQHIKGAMHVTTPNRVSHNSTSFTPGVVTGFVPGEVGNVSDVGPADGPPAEYNADVGPADGPPDDGRAPGNTPGFTPGDIGRRARGPKNDARVYNADVGPADGPPDDARVYNADVGPAAGPDSDSAAEDERRRAAENEQSNRAAKDQRNREAVDRQNREAEDRQSRRASKDERSRSYIDTQNRSAENSQSRRAAEDEIRRADEQDRINSMSNGAYTPGNTPGFTPGDIGSPAAGPDNDARVGNSSNGNSSQSRYSAAEDTITGTQVDQTMATSDNINKINVPDNYDTTRTNSDLDKSKSINTSANNYGADTVQTPTQSIPTTPRSSSVSNRSGKMTRRKY